MTTKPILSIAEVAELLGCHRDTVTDRIRSGKLKAAQPGRQILIKLDDVYAMLDKHPVTP